MTYEVKLDQFEGPLDLLLHLISKSKIQIEDISIAEITQQYLQALQAMQRFDIEIASEFLVMASTLLHIKSSVLLPKPKIELEDEDSIETREDLIARLIEYKKYKEASEQLQKESHITLLSLASFQKRFLQIQMMFYLLIYQLITYIWPCTNY